jgi:hypothetical protein
MSISKPSGTWPKLAACAMLLGLMLGSTTLLRATEASEKSILEKSFDRIVKGRITDAANGSGLAGASVTVKGTSASALTDGQGNFSVSIPDDKAVLVVSFIGYNTLEIVAGNRNFTIGTTITTNIHTSFIGF